jgi:hypothetical protein
VSLDRNEEIRGPDYRMRPADLQWRAADMAALRLDDVRH